VRAGTGERRALERSESVSRLESERREGTKRRCSDERGGTTREEGAALCCGAVLLR